MTSPSSSDVVSTGPSTPRTSLAPTCTTGRPRRGAAGRGCRRRPRPTTARRGCRRRISKAQDEEEEDEPRRGDADGEPAADVPTKLTPYWKEVTSWWRLRTIRQLDEEMYEGITDARPAQDQEGPRSAAQRSRCRAACSARRRPARARRRRALEAVRRRAVPAQLDIEKVFVPVTRAAVLIFASVMPSYIFVKMRMDKDVRQPERLPASLLELGNDRVRVDLQHRVVAGDRHRLVLAVLVLVLAPSTRSSRAPRSVHSRRLRDHGSAAAAPRASRSTRWCRAGGGSFKGCRPATDDAARREVTPCSSADGPRHARELPGSSSRSAADRGPERRALINIE